MWNVIIPTDLPQWFSATYPAVALFVFVVTYGFICISILFICTYCITDYIHCLRSISMYVSTQAIHPFLLYYVIYIHLLNMYYRWLPSHSKHYKHVWVTYSSNSMFIICPNMSVSYNMVIKHWAYQYFPRFGLAGDVPLSIKYSF